MHPPADSTVAEFLALPSARKHNLTVSRPATVSQFVKWVQSAEAVADNLGQVYVGEISWAQDPGIPTHEYLIAKFHGRYNGALRIERDTDHLGWRTLFNPTARAITLDTVTFIPFENDDQILATLTIFHSTIQLTHLALLLQVISAASTSYNIWTFNCWWFAGCIWRNLAKLAGNWLDFRWGAGIKQTSPVRKLATMHSPSAFSAVEFAEIQQILHHGALERALGSSESREELEAASAHIDSTFVEQVASRQAVEGQFSDLIAWEKKVYLCSDESRPPHRQALGLDVSHRLSSRHLTRRPWTLRSSDPSKDCVPDGVPQLVKESNLLLRDLQFVNEEQWVYRLGLTWGGARSVEQVERPSLEMAPLVVERLFSESIVEEKRISVMVGAWSTFVLEKGFDTRSLGGRGGLQIAKPTLRDFATLVEERIAVAKRQLTTCVRIRVRYPVSQERLYMADPEVIGRVISLTRSRVAALKEIGDMITGLLHTLALLS
ncbi:hypothetical protein JAAARDRAFT_36399 [Jaapia argillacea MUCL 33604]|uniref:Uncharacterized protein n=1 Tax=Jaapia argillacea MUCL 33604 TaxID=933084 RepID=A0A067PY61_9AGAM|nr:hypothetical protein JAAARDRAFT_36399 [Jaapia argillacea MUCL 33604]